MKLGITEHDRTAWTRLVGPTHPCQKYLSAAKPCTITVCSNLFGTACGLAPSGLPSGWVPKPKTKDLVLRLRRQDSCLLRFTDSHRDALRDQISEIVVQSLGADCGRPRTHPRVPSSTRASTTDSKHACLGRCDDDSVFAPPTRVPAAGQTNGSAQPHNANHASCTSPHSSGLDSARHPKAERTSLLEQPSTLPQPKHPQ